MIDALKFPVPLCDERGVEGSKVRSIRYLTSSKLVCSPWEVLCLVPKCPGVEKDLLVSGKILPAPLEM